MNETQNANNTRPAVSVIIPIYNCAQYVVECIESLKAQTFSDFEAICVDDCSTDNSLDATRAAIAGDPRFKLLPQPVNRGLSATRNVGLDAMQGEYALFLDSDDKYLPTTIEELVTRARAQELDNLYFTAESFYENPEDKKLLDEDYALNFEFDDVANGQDFFIFLTDHEPFWPNAVLRMISKELIDEHNLRFWEGILHEDELFTTHALLVSKRCSLINKPFYQRRVRANSIMTKKSTVRDVWGDYVCIRELSNWLYAHANEVSLELVDHLSKRIMVLKSIAGGIWFYDVSEEEQQAFLKSLDPLDLARFCNEVAAPFGEVYKREQEYLNSASFKTGRALLAVPRKIRGALGSK